MNHEDKFVKDGLTLEQARKHCKDPQTSSRTATSEEAQERTKQFGPWFEAFEKH